jgi:hypothetical protein
MVRSLKVEKLKWFKVGSLRAVALLQNSLSKLMI